MQREEATASFLHIANEAYYARSHSVTTTRHRRD